MIANRSAAWLCAVSSVADAPLLITHLGQQLSDSSFFGRVTGVFYELQIQALAPRLLEIPSRAGLTT